MTSFSTEGGYNCGVCGAWVTSGTAHICGRVYPTTGTPLHTDAVALALGRIEALLQQILRKLETS